MQRFTLVAAGVLASAGLLVACGSDNGGSSSATAVTSTVAQTSAAGGSATSGSDATTTSGSDATTTSGSDATTTAGGTTTTAGDTTTTRPSARFDLVASPDNVQCAFVPNGGLDGRDSLNVFMFVLVIGANPSDVGSLVSVDTTSDTGISGSQHVAVSNQAAVSVQASVPATAFGQTTHLVIAVNADGAIAETDRSNDRVAVTLELPSRPNRAIDPLSCTASAA
jgi:hypothetical protein